MLTFELLFDIISLQWYCIKFILSIKIYIKELANDRVRKNN